MILTLEFEQGLDAPAGRVSCNGAFGVFNDFGVVLTVSHSTTAAGDGDFSDRYSYLMIRMV